MQIQVSLDFDLTQCDIGRMYLKAMRDYLPLLLPIGLYLEPYVGFDLRDSGDSRISFIAQRERIEVTERIKAIEREMEGESDLLSVLDEQGLTIAIAELPANGSCSSGRGVLHYSYLGRWRQDDSAFPFLPNPASESPRLGLREWWQRKRMLLGWCPMRVVMPLWNMRFSESLHVELHTPEGIRVHKSGIFAQTSHVLWSSWNITGEVSTENFPGGEATTPSTGLRRFWQSLCWWQSLCCLFRGIRSRKNGS
jgi:hypothetical protein